MGNDPREPLDMDLEMPLSGQPEAGPETTGYLPPFPNYYLHRAAKFAQWVFWISAIGVSYSLYFDVAYFARRLDSETSIFDYFGVLLKSVMEFCVMGFPLIYLYRFSIKTKLGIETEDAPKIDSGIRSLYFWFVTTLITQGALIGYRVLSTLLFTFLSVKGSLALTLFVLLATFMGYYVWREKMAADELE